jgi:hypothetical protein
MANERLLDQLIHVNSLNANPVGEFKRPLIQSVKKHCVILQAVINGKKKPFGTGVLIDGKHVLTAAHIFGHMAATDPNYHSVTVQFNVAYTAATVDSKAPILETTRPEFAMKAEVASSVNLDYAIITIEDAVSQTPALIETEKINNASYDYQWFGKQVLAVQHPMGEPMQISAGYCYLVNTDWQNTDPKPGNYHVCGLKSKNGSSGSGAYNITGKLIGILIGHNWMNLDVRDQNGRLIKRSTEITSFLSLNKIYEHSAYFRSIAGPYT